MRAARPCSASARSRRWPAAAARLGRHRRRLERRLRRSPGRPGHRLLSLRFAGATWYGPGFYGKQTACGQTLRPGTLGVAHRSLPCGTVVKFVFGGRQIVTRVIDRGPYAKGFAWDLTNGTREALGFEGSGRIRYAVAAQYARP